MDGYTTLSQAMEELRKQGYTEDLNLQPDCLVCRGRNLTLSAEDFKVDQVFRFEGESDPSDESILYAISSDRFGLKGLLVNGYGIYSEPVAAELVSKLKIHGR